MFIYYLLRLLTLIYGIKIRTIICISFSFSLSFSLFSQNDTVKVKEVEILSDRIPMLYSQTSRIVEVITKEKIQQLPAQTIDEVLKYALNIDVRQRGDFNVQSDISIRGGSNEETLILLNGVKINDPQTGHHNINIPVELNDIERIEILEGPGSRIFGPDAFSGAINIITVHSPQSTDNSQQKGNVKLALAGGEYGYYDGSASFTFNSGNINNYISLNNKGSDGYITDTDFKISSFLYQGDYKKKGINMNLMASYLDKRFGAFNFYSAQPPYQNEYEQTKTSFINFKTSFGNIFHWTTNLYWRTNQDKFELFRENPPSWYTHHNYHLTNIIGADVNTYYISKFGKTAFGAEVRREGILSNVLGDPLNDTIRYKGLSWGYYDHKRIRDNLNVFAEHIFTLNKFSASAGLLANSTTSYDLKFYPGLDISYQLSNSFKIYASANKSLRLPTFTDIYYSGPINLGNPDLKPEEAWTYETGLKYSGKYINNHVSVFRRYITNTIDWIKTNPSQTKWQSMNLTKLTSDGIEFSTDILFNKIYNSSFIIQNLSISYSYINTKKNSGDYISFYALDYLRNKISVTIYHKIIRNFTASWSYSYNQRAGSYIEYPSKLEKSYQPYSVFDGKITYKRNHFRFYIETSNILNKSYIDIANIQMPGRWLKSGVNYNLK
jgi:vitamin B12 transporter